MVPPTIHHATDNCALVRLRRLFPSRTVFRLSQESIVNQNSNINTVFANSSVINNVNLVNNLVQAAAEQVCSASRMC